MVGLARSHLGSNGRLGEPSLPNDREPNSRGDRKPDDWLRYILRSRVSAIGYRVRVFRFRFRYRFRPDTRGCIG